MRINRRFLDINFTVKGYTNSYNDIANPSIGDAYLYNDGTDSYPIVRFNGKNWDIIKPSGAQLEILRLDTGEILTFDNIKKCWKTVYTIYPKINDDKCYFVKNGKWIEITEEINKIIKSYLENLNNIVIDGGKINN